MGLEWVQGIWILSQPPKILPMQVVCQPHPNMHLKKCHVSLKRHHGDSSFELLEACIISFIKFCLYSLYFIMFYWKTFDVQNGSLCFNAYLIQKAWLGGFGSCKKDQSALKNKTKQTKNKFYYLWRSRTFSCKWQKPNLNHLKQNKFIGYRTKMAMALREWSLVAGWVGWTC